MTCSRARKWIALHAGGDLHSRRARRLETHLRKCAGCRAELEEHKSILDAVRGIAGRETLDWSETEWKSLMAQTTRKRPEAVRLPPLAAFPKRAWAYGSAVLLLAGISVLILRALFSPPAPLPVSEKMPPTPLPPSRPLPGWTAASAAPARDLPFRIPSEQKAIARTAMAARPADGKPAQDVLSLTLVSQETGLRVHWTFNRNFEWEEKRR